MNNTITEMKSTLDGINTRITKAEEWISDLKEWWNLCHRTKYRKKNEKK